MEGFGRFIQENSYQEGHQDGCAEGKILERVSMIKALMISLNKSFDEVVKLAHLSDEQINEIKDLVEYKKECK